MGDYRKLKAWWKAHELALSVYRATVSFPSTERYGLASQMRRAATSVATNIVEGVGRNRRGETAHFVRVALGSCAELESQVFPSRELEYLERDLASGCSPRCTDGSYRSHPTPSPRKHDRRRPIADS
ncbi:MAG: four helix bundle protein [bacterium]